MHDGHTNSLPNPIGGAIGDRILSCTAQVVLFNPPPPFSSSSALAPSCDRSLFPDLTVVVLHFTPPLIPAETMSLCQNRLQEERYVTFSGFPSAIQRDCYVYADKFGDPVANNGAVITPLGSSQNPSGRRREPWTLSAGNAPYPERKIPSGKVEFTSWM